MNDKEMVEIRSRVIDTFTPCKCETINREALVEAGIKAGYEKLQAENAELKARWYTLEREALVEAGIKAGYEKLQAENAELKARWYTLERMAERKAKFFDGKNPSDFYFGEQSTWAFIHSWMKEAGKG